MTYRLTDKVLAELDGKVINKPLRWWIYNHPYLVYNMIYCHHSKLPHIKVNKDAHKLLTYQLEQYDPLLLHKIQSRRTERLKKAAIKNQIGSS